MNSQLNKKEINFSLKSIFLASSFILITVLLSKILTYSYRIIIARYFGPEVYGMFSLAGMILSFSFAIASFGLLDGVVRFISYYRGKKEKDKIIYLFRTTFSVLLISGIISTIILFTLSETVAIKIFNTPELTIFLKVFSFLIPFYLFMYFFLAILQAYEKVKIHSFILDFSENFFKLFFLIILLFIGLKTNAIIFSFSLGVVATFVFATTYVRLKIPEIFSKYSLEQKEKKQLKVKLISYSWPLIFSSLFLIIFPFIDSFVIGYFKGALDVGLYNSAVPFAALLVLFPNLFARLFFPLITREYSKKNFKVINALTKQVQKWILILNLPLFLMMFIFPGAIINIFFGTEFILAENALRILSIGFLFNSFSLLLSNLISMVGKTKLILTNIIITNIFNIILNIILVPKFGITGAAISTTLSYALLTLIFFIQVNHYLSFIPLKRKMLNIIISAIIPTIALIYIKQFTPINLLTILVLGIFFTLFYTLMIFLTKSLDENDLMILHTIKKKLKHKNSKQTKIHTSDSNY